MYCETGGEGMSARQPFATTTAQAVASASLPAIALLALTLFLLSADVLHVVVAGHKIKYGYFFVPALWLVEPTEMVAVAVAALRRLPRWPLLVLVPLAIAVATSANVRNSVWWTLWLGFDAFTVLTVYAYLRAHRFSERQVAGAVTAALGLVALGALVQFVAIYFAGRVILSPQKHFDLYRINGLAGWPHFLCIFSFLLLPLVMTQERLQWWARVVLVVLAFGLVQSTAKTGWVMFIALGALLLWFRHEIFKRNYLLFLLPVTVAALLIPVPVPTSGAPPMSGSEKIQVFAEDLDLTKKTTSGTDRVLISKMGLAVWSKHPWFGVGPKAYADYVWTRFDRELPGVNKLDASGNVNAKNENIWVEWLAENGALFTLGFALVLLRALWTPGFAFRNPLHLGTWIALVLYFGVSGQVSQNGLLTLVYAVFGVYFYARDLPAVAKWAVLTRSVRDVPPEAIAPLTTVTRPGP